MTEPTVVRVSVLRCAPEQFPKLSQMMADADATLRPGIAAMPGLIAFYVGADPATNSLTNTSIWASLAAAQQLDHFQPMLDLGKTFAAAGATFERPIMNYGVQWRIDPDA